MGQDRPSAAPHTASRETTLNSHESSVVTVLRAAGRSGVATLLWGAPGEGKSSVIRALAAADGVGCEVVLGSIREPADFAGLPVVMDTGVSMEAPSWAKRLAAAGNGIAFLDEITTSTPATQAAMLGVALDRKVGDLQLPDAVQVVAAANPPEQAADGYDLAAPLANRFCHIEWKPSVDGWLNGMMSGFSAPQARPVLDLTGEARDAAISASRSVVAAFVRTRPTLLNAVPADPAGAGRAWPSRRTWTMLADTLAFLPATDSDARLMTAEGLVGEAAAVEFLTWARLADLPNPADVLADPSIVEWDDRPDKVWAILAGVVAHCTAAKTATMWRKAWGPLAACADATHADVAASAARSLLSNIPDGATPPAEAKAFVAILRQAGLMTSIAGGQRKRAKVA